jgi:hypothetical protein
MAKRYKLTMFIDIENVTELKKFLKSEDYDWNDFFNDYGCFAEATMFYIKNDFGEFDFEIKDLIGSVKVEEFKHVTKDL